MADAAIAVDLLQAADVSRQGTAQVALDKEVVLKNFGDRTDLVRSKVLGFQVRIDTDFLNDFQRFGRADAVKITQRKFDALVARNVNTNNTASHQILYIRFY